MIQAIASTTAMAGSPASATLGAIPAAYSFLLWAPLLALASGLALWLAVLVVLQRRQSRPLRAKRPAGVAWTRYGLTEPQPQP